MKNHLIQPVTICLPDLPQRVEGLKIAHLSDLHIRRFRKKFRRLAEMLGELAVDLAVWTGDYMSLRGDEPRSLEVMTRLCEAFHPPLGMYGVFGNHDTSRLRAMLEALPIRWLVDSRVLVGNLPLWIYGFHREVSAWADTLATVGGGQDTDESGVGMSVEVEGGSSARQKGEEGQRAVRVLLCHEPTGLVNAADLGMDLMLAGHTHGGQMRLGQRGVIFNSSAFPRGLTSGVMRHKDTICVVTRGLGENWVPMRVMCPDQLPVYTLRRGPRVGRRTTGIDNVIPW